MSQVELASEATALDLARECLYRFLAVALREPQPETESLLRDRRNQRLARAAAALLGAEAGAEPFTLGFGEAASDQLDLEPLLHDLPPTLEGMRAEYDRVFGLVFARECPPYETEYHQSSETFFRAQELADIAGFYRAFGLDITHATPERPDHLAVELEFMAFVLMKKRLALAAADADPEALEHADICAVAEQSFFRAHLAWWVPSFATGLRRKAGNGFYAAVGQVLAALLPAERQRLSVAAPRLSLQPALIERPEEQGGCTTCPAQG